MELSLTPQALEQHGRFVRGLARALLTDPGRADDVAQEALTRWVFDPPAEASRTRSWLATVVRRLASNTRRSESRRRVHEEHAARPEAVRSAREENEQAELVQRVIDAVMALEPELRDTILGRHFRGLTAGQLAAELGLSESAVRARERRALETLRVRLDRSHASRAAWALGLGRLVRSGAPEATVGAGVVSAGALALAAVGVAALTGALWLTRGGAASAPGATEPVLAHANAPSDPSATSSATAAVLGTVGRTPVDPRGVAVRPGSPRPPSSEAFVQDHPATLRGRVLLSDGAPAVAAPIHVMGWGANEEREIQFGLPENWTDPETVTDAQGNFELQFVPPRAFQFTLDLGAPLHAGASWRWGEILPGVVVDLGTVTLARGATVEGHLVDASGNPILGGSWTVYLTSEGLRRLEGRDECRVHAPVDPATGFFRAENVMPGPNEFQGYSRMVNWFDGERVNAVGGETLTTNLVYAGPDTSHRIQVTTFCRPFYPIERIDPAHLWLVLPSGERRQGHAIPHSSQSYAFDDLAPGSYGLEIDDPRFLPWSQSGVQPGAAVSAHLEPSAAAQLTVLGPDGAPVSPYALTAEFLNVNFFPREIVVSDGTTSIAGGTVRIPPGDFLLRVQADGLQGQALLTEIEAGETRVVTISLAQALAIAGHLTTASGAPAAGVNVLLLEPAEVDDSNGSRILAPNTMTSDANRWRRQVGATTTEADGSFHFPITTAGSFIVCAGDQGGLRSFSDVFVLAAGESRSDLELALPQGGSVQGTVFGPDGAPCAGMRLWVGAIDEEDPMQFVRLRKEARTIAADGSFAFEDLSAGTLTAYLFLPEPTAPLALRSGSAGWDRISLGTFELAPGEQAARYLEAPVKPGQLSIDVSCNGQPAAGVQVTLSIQGATSWRESVRFTTDASGHFGPVQLFPGAWEATASDLQAGWSESVPTAVQLASAGSAQAQIDVQVADGTVRLLDASGSPIANRGLRVVPDLGANGGSFVITSNRRQTTDADGRVRLVLTAGTYEISLNQENGLPQMGPDVPTVTLHWTLQGPQEAELSFSE